MRFSWFWSQPPPSRPLPKPWKCWQSYAFLMNLEPISSLPPTSKDMKMMTVLCISYDSETSRVLSHQSLFWGCGKYPTPPSHGKPGGWGLAQGWHKVRHKVRVGFADNLPIVITGGRWQGPDPSSKIIENVKIPIVFWGGGRRRAPWPHFPNQSEHDHKHSFLGRREMSGSRWHPYTTIFHFQVFYYRNLQYLVIPVELGYSTAIVQ